MIETIREDVFNSVIDQYIPPQSIEEMWDVEGLEVRLDREFGMKLPIKEWLETEKDLHEETLRERILNIAKEAYKAKEEIVGAETLRNFEKGIVLQTLDELWKEHLSAMDYLRKGIHLRSYGQKDPKNEYKKESFAMFTHMLDVLKTNVISVLSRIQVRSQEEVEAERRQYAEALAQAEAAAEANANVQSDVAAEQTDGEPLSDEELADLNISRNDPCPCGSGKKYKHCHGSKARYA